MAVVVNHSLILLIGLSTFLIQHVDCRLFGINKSSSIGSICGGTGSSAVVNSACWAWSKQGQPAGVKPISAPPTVSGHLTCSSDGSKIGIKSVPPTSVYLFGGLTGPAGSPTTSDLFEYDVGGWKHFPPKEGSKTSWPRQRMYTAGDILLPLKGDKSSSSSSPKMYIFGGWDPGEPGSGGEFLKDIWSMDLLTKEWTELDVDLPYPVSRHSACTVGDNRIVIVTYSGVLVFLLEYDDEDGIQPTVAMVDCSGDKPDGFSMSAQVPIGSDGVLLFGGSTKTQQLSADAYYLDTSVWKWTKLTSVSEDGSDCPVATASPCAAPVPGSSNQAIVFGGASIGSDGYEGGAGLTPLNDTWFLTVDLEKSEVKWKKILSDDGDSPEPRLAATLTNIPSEGGTRMLLQGGYDSTEKKTFGESWILSN